LSQGWQHYNIKYIEDIFRIISPLCQYQELF
jgi:hypothetical protein